MKNSTFIIALIVVAAISIALTWLWRDSVKVPSPGSVVTKHDTVRTKETITNLVPRPYPVHDTLTVRDTLRLSATPDTLYGGAVVADTTVNNVSLYIVYEQPTMLHPLGIFSTISVDYPRYLDSTTVHPFVTTPWWVLPVTIISFVLGILLGHAL